jgi:hypothetical protein
MGKISWSMTFFVLVVLASIALDGIRFVVRQSDHNLYDELRAIREAQTELLHSRLDLESAQSAILAGNRTDVARTLNPGLDQLAHFAGADKSLQNDYQRLILLMSRQIAQLEHSATLQVTDKQVATTANYLETQLKNREIKLTQSLKRGWLDLIDVVAMIFHGPLLIFSFMIVLFRSQPEQQTSQISWQLSEQASFIEQKKDKKRQPIIDQTKEI